MNIGYACLTVGVRNADLKTCNLKNATTENLERLIQSNLISLKNIFSYNIKNNIKLFRISSDIIPFGSSPKVEFPWRVIFSDKLFELGQMAKEQGLRLSMHPGQYTVLNSPRPDVVKNAILDLNYHCAFLDSLGMDASNKIILHIGGAYTDKKAAIENFMTNFSYLDEGVKRRIVLENDDRIFHIGDILTVAEKLSLPAVFDILHHKVNPCFEEKSAYDLISICKKTWGLSDGPQKIHYSGQAQGKKAGSHSDTICAEEFLKFAHHLDKNIDIMLEVKDKNLSAIKCINCIDTNVKTAALEEEWAKYKYTVLERSPKIYAEIRTLLNNKKSCPAPPFYQLIEESMKEKPEPKRALNALLHVWGYFKVTASEKEKKEFGKKAEQFKNNEISLNNIKLLLKRLSEKYQAKYLLDSYYFDLS